MDVDNGMKIIQQKRKLFDSADIIFCGPKMAVSGLKKVFKMEEKR